MKAKISDFKLLDPKDPTKPPSLVIRFACEDGKARNWYGYFTEKAKDITLGVLLILGFDVNKDPSDLAGGVESGLLDTEKEVDLTLGMETYEGKTREKVQWVNEVGGAKFKNEMSKQDAVKKFAGMNLRADLMAKKAMMPKAEDEEMPF